MKRELTNTETGILTIRSYSKDLTKKPGVYKMLDTTKIYYTSEKQKTYSIGLKAIQISTTIHTE